MKISVQKTICQSTFVPKVEKYKLILKYIKSQPRLFATKRFLRMAAIVLKMQCMKNVRKTPNKNDVAIKKIR
jgi:hypothetical protein